jgi:uncharacterized membrane protein
MDDVTAFKTLEPVVDHAIRVVGSGIEIFGVLIIVTGIAWSTFRQLLQRISDQDSEVYKIRVGRSLLLGLEVLVAADIVKTIAHELTSMSLILLAGLVLVRTFPELDAGVGNRGPMALATRTVTHVIESSCRKRDRCALIRCADPPCCKVRIGERSNRAQTFPSRLFSN